jgi:hypothetical protein
MRRKTVINWAPAHDRLREAIANGVEHPAEVGVTEKGWSYVTFCSARCKPEDILYDVNRLQTIAKDNGFYLPGDVIRQHNKVLIVARSGSMEPSAQLFGLWRFLMEYEKLFNNTDTHPQHSFYGKFGGNFERSEKGRVLAIYSSEGDEALMAIYEACEALASRISVPGVTFEVGVSAGLSAIPRLLAGFDDPEYRATGVDFYRINNPAEFEELLEVARNDFPKYLFISTD